jgi:hypothetical protein
MRTSNPVIIRGGERNIFLKQLQEMLFTCSDACPAGTYSNCIGCPVAAECARWWEEVSDPLYAPRTMGEYMRCVVEFDKIKKARKT